MQPELLDSLIANWPDQASGHCHLALALSGGLDSIVLLDLLARWRDERGGPALSALHVHHGISHHADAWLAHCQAQCAGRGVPLRTVRIELQRSGGDSLEALARAARYQAFADAPATVLALAHHGDDQSETVLLQLLRGGGPHALAAMPSLREWQGKLLWRPLLGCSRRQLEAYAQARALTWVDDDSNADAAAYLRNHLRLLTLPALRLRVPDLDAKLMRSAQRMADAAQVLDEVAAEDLARLLRDDALSRAEVLALSPARQRCLLLAWIGRQGWPQPSPAALFDWQRRLVAGEQAQLSLRGGLLLSYRDRVLALARLPLPQQQQGTLRVGEPLSLAHGCVRWQRAAGGLPLDWQGRELAWRWRQDGDSLQHRVGRMPLKKLFQQQGVPALLRAGWPVLLATDGSLLALPGVAVATTVASDDGWWPRWLPAGVLSA